MTGVLIGEGAVRTQTCTQGERHVNVKVEIVAVRSQSRGQQRWPETTRSSGRGGEQIVSHGLRRNQPCPHLGLELLASRTVRRGISVKPPSC